MPPQAEVLVVVKMHAGSSSARPLRSESGAGTRARDSCTRTARSCGSIQGFGAHMPVWFGRNGEAGGNLEINGRSLVLRLIIWVERSGG